MSRAADDRAPHASLCTAVLLAAIELLSACRQQHSPTHTQQSSAPPVATPATAAETRHDPTPPQAPTVTTADASAVDTLVVRAVIAAVPTEYSASFVAGQLRSISETRAAAQWRGRGLYEFYGARLIRYSGEQLTTATAVQLEFDLQGALISPLADLDREQIEQIKSRAQLLRSHALAQQATRTH